jgi:hypothetical protein
VRQGSYRCCALVVCGKAYSAVRRIYSATQQFKPHAIRIALFTFFFREFVSLSGVTMRGSPIILALAIERDLLDASRKSASGPQPRTAK